MPEAVVDVAAAPLFALHRRLVRVLQLEGEHTVTQRVDACPTLAVPPLVAAPDPL